jgi:hypothetical protein
MKSTKIIKIIKLDKSLINCQYNLLTGESIFQILPLHYFEDDSIYFYCDFSNEKSVGK